MMKETQRRKEHAHALPPSTPPPRRNCPPSYIWQDLLTDAEIKTLQMQDHLVTVVMGGVLPEQPETSRFRYILGLGCGTGNWLIEVAQMYPTATHLIGIDAIASAQAQAETYQVSDRVQFR